MRGANRVYGNMGVRSLVTVCDGKGVCGGLEGWVFACRWFDSVCEAGRCSRLSEC
jgi:hypothetical protein